MAAVRGTLTVMGAKSSWSVLTCLACLGYVAQPWLVPEDQEHKLCGENGCQWGKEIVMKYSASTVESGGSFYTDSNGRELLLRKRNERGPSYPPLNVSEPIAG